MFWEKLSIFFSRKWLCIRRKYLVGIFSTFTIIPVYASDHIFEMNKLIHEIFHSSVFVEYSEAFGASEIIKKKRWKNGFPEIILIPTSEA